MKPLVIVFLRSSYVVLRRWNRPSENVPTAQASSGLQLRRDLESKLLHQLEQSADHADIHAILARDHAHLTTASLEAAGGRRVQLEHIRRLRPLQPAGFLDSPGYADLPAWARDAIVLVDLRQVLGQWGLRNYLTAGSDFYCRDVDRAIDVAVRAGSTGLADRLVLARGLSADTDDVSFATISAELEALLDSPDAWDGVLAHDDGRGRPGTHQSST